MKGDSPCTTASSGVPSWGLPFLSLLAICAALFSVGPAQLEHFADDPGVGWHLKTGEYVEQSGPPANDPFLVLPLGSAARPWVSDQWLSDILFFKLYMWGGWSALYVLATGVFLATFSLVLVGDVRNRIGSVLPAIAVSLIAFKCSQVHFILRPVIFSFFCFAICSRLSWRLTSATSVIREVKVLALPFVVLFLLWANLHPGFILGFLVLGAALFSSLMRPASRSFGSLCAAALLIALCIGTTAINPYGFGLHRSILALGSSSFFMNLNQEWRPINLDAPEGQLLELLISIAVAGVALWRPAGRLPWFEMLVAIPLTYKAITSVRFLPFASIALAPLASAGMLEISKVAFRRFKTFRRFGAVIDRFEAPSLVRAFVLVGGGALGLGVWARCVLNPERLGPNSAVYPGAAVAYLRSLDGAGGAVVASPDWGGYLTWCLYPRYRAVIDDRNILLGEGAYRAWFGAHESVSAFDRYVRMFGARYVLLAARERGFSLVGQLNWKRVSSDSAGTLFEVPMSESMP